MSFYAYNLYPIWHFSFWDLATSTVKAVPVLQLKTQLSFSGNSSTCQHQHMV